MNLPQSWTSLSFHCFRSWRCHRDYVAAASALQVEQAETANASHQQELQVGKSEREATIRSQLVSIVPNCRSEMPMNTGPGLSQAVKLTFFLSAPHAEVTEAW